MAYLSAYDKRFAALRHDGKRAFLVGFNNDELVESDRGNDTRFIVVKTDNLRHAQSVVGVDDL